MSGSSGEAGPGEAGPGERLRTGDLSEVDEMPADPRPVAELASAVVSGLVAAGTTVATAESLTGGLLTAAMTSVPGSSAVVRGGVVAYATDAKVSLLGVDPGLLESVGPVDRTVAEQMAAGAAARLGATYGVATTGEAGPDSATGAPVGTVYVAAVGPGVLLSAGMRFPGGRAEVRVDAVRAALDLLAKAVGHD